jgi:hypothetical protein
LERSRDASKGAAQTTFSFKNILQHLMGAVPRECGVKRPRECGVKRGPAQMVLFKGEKLKLRG